MQNLRDGTLSVILICVGITLAGTRAETYGSYGSYGESSDELPIQAIRVLDLSSLPDEMSNCDCTYNPFAIFVPLEKQTDIVLDASASPLAALEGTYELTPALATALNDAILEALPFISPEDAAVTIMDNPIASYYNGTSYDEDALRLPTIWEPTRAGHVFEYPEDDFYAMNVRNHTLLDGSVEFANLHESTLFDYVKLTPGPGVPIGNSICFANSILVLKSCEGYPTDVVIESVCCALSGCDLRTRQDLIDDNFGVPDELDPIKCYSMQEE